MTLREKTERPETVDEGGEYAGWNRISAIKESARKMLGMVEGWKNPFGEGNAGQRITKIIGNQGGPRETETVFLADFMRLTDKTTKLTKNAQRRFS